MWTTSSLVRLPGKRDLTDVHGGTVVMDAGIAPQGQPDVAACPGLLRGGCHHALVESRPHVYDMHVRQAQGRGH